MPVCKEGLRGNIENRAFYRPIYMGLEREIRKKAGTRSH